MGKVERNLPKSRLKGEGAWFMMFVSNSEKTSHQKKPSTRPERRARLIVMILSLWNEPKMRPNTPPSTMIRKNPANLLVVGSAMVMPNQCKASGNVRPGVPSVTKLSIASTRPANSPASNPLRMLVMFSAPLHLSQTSLQIDQTCCNSLPPAHEGQPLDQHPGVALLG